MHVPGEYSQILWQCLDGIVTHSYASLNCNIFFGQSLEKLFAVPGKQVTDTYLDYLWKLLSTKMKTTE